MSRYVHCCTNWLRPLNITHPPPPTHWDLYTRATLVSKDRRHLFITPWQQVTVNFYVWVCGKGCATEARPWVSRGYGGGGQPGQPGRLVRRSGTAAAVSGGRPWRGRGSTGRCAFFSPLHVNYISVLRIRIWDLVLFWPLGSGMGKKSGSLDQGWTTRVIFPRAWKQFVGLNT